MKKKKIIETLKALHKDERGQLDLIGNLIELIKTIPWVLPLLVLAILYTTTLTFNIAGVDVNLGGPLTEMFRFMSGAFGFNFDWRLFVIIIFLTVPTLFIIRYGWGK